MINPSFSFNLLLSDIFHDPKMCYALRVYEYLSLQLYCHHVLYLISMLSCHHFATMPLLVFNCHVMPIGLQTLTLLKRRTDL